MASPLDSQHEFLVGIDSDGCAFDTMELKHKECFIPNIIQHFGMQPISKYAREVAEFVNLYSTSRGKNRFPALIETFAWLKKRPEVAARGWNHEVPAALVEWVQNETMLSNPSLEKAIANNSADATKVTELRHALAWSESVNKTIGEMVRGVPPFPGVHACLDRLATKADILIVSATPNEALEREWAEHDLSQFVTAICGQESGSKKESLAVASKYPQGKALMIGDAPGDLSAANANGVLFFPINPGGEEDSWRQFADEGLDRFLQGTFAGSYQQALLDEFNQRLPATPPWPVCD